MMKDPDPHKLRDEIKTLQTRLETRRNMLQQVVNRCQHDWGKTEYKPEYHKAYTIPGDPPGTMGVDRRGPCHVPASTDKKWQRVCKKCGCKQVTSRTKWVSGGGGAGLGSKEEVPDFR
jgi:hypothetical protein